jgi:hypothetical protein
MKANQHHQKFFLRKNVIAPLVFEPNHSGWPDEGASLTSYRHFLESILRVRFVDNLDGFEICAFYHRDNIQVPGTIV